MGCTGPVSPQTYAFIENMLGKHTVSLPPHLLSTHHAIKQSAESWTRHYIFIDPLILLHRGEYATQLWAESVTRVRWG